MSTGKTLTRSDILNLDDSMMTYRSYGTQIDFDAYYDKSIMCETYSGNTVNCPCPVTSGKFLVFKGYFALQVFVPLNTSYPIYHRIVVGSTPGAWCVTPREILASSAWGGGKTFILNALRVRAERRAA